jgi:hypothetical protein
MESKPWWQSLTIQTIVCMTFLMLLTWLGEWPGWDSVAKQIIHKVAIDAGALAVLAMLLGGAGIFGRIRVGGLK